MADLLILLAALAAAQAPVAKADPAFLPSTPVDIASAVGDCWRAVGPGGIDFKRLANSGGVAVVDANGQRLKTTLDTFLKSGANHRIMIPQAAEAKPLCAVIARISSPSERGATAGNIGQLLLAIDPGLTAAEAGQGVLFQSGPTFALVDDFEFDYVTKEQPGLRITVGYKIAEKK